MPKYEAEDKLTLGRLFRDLVLARQVIVKGNKTLVDEIDNSSLLNNQQKEELVALVNDPKLVERFQDFVHNPAKRKKMLEQATLMRLEGDTEDDVRMAKLDDSDTTRFNVVLDSEYEFHIALPDQMMHLNQYASDIWMEQVGGYIMRKCR